MLQTIVNVVDHAMSIEQAVVAPRIHHQWLPDRIEYEEAAGGLTSRVDPVESLRSE